MTEQQTQAPVPMTQVGTLRILNATTTLSLTTIADVLSKLPFLHGVAKEKLTELISSSFLRRYKNGDKVIVQGEYGHSLFVVVQGVVQVEATADNGQVLKLARFSQPGECFGELAILGRTRRTASAISDGESTLLEIEKTRLEKLDKDTGAVLQGIESFSQKRALHTFLSQHRAFSELSTEQLQRLVEVSTLSVHPRGTTVFAEKDPVREVFIVKSGVAKLVREEAGGMSVLAYFNTGDVIGLWDLTRRVASLVSMGYVEIIHVPRADFEKLRNVREGFFDQFYKADLARAARTTQLAQKASTSNPGVKSPAPPVQEPRGISVPGVGQGETVFNFVEQLVLEGAQEAQSLLTIDLNLCVRCGNCVRACEMRHGHARMTRRGKKLVRREKIEQAGKYQTLLLPSSCRHCVNPECMIGCPTGAIHRMATGEVDIHNFCIGCGNCANRCPWDNIQMVPSPGRMVNNAEMKQLATKCNLCAGFEYSNCVHNCPTGAILRIEPNSYFEEVQQVLGKSAQKAIGTGGRTETKRKVDLTKILFPAVALILALAFVGLVITSKNPLVTFSPQGIALGIAATLCMLGAASLGARRKFARFRSQLGAFLAWTRAHVYLGLLAFVAVLLHSGLRFGGGVVTSMLLVLTVLEIATGIFGILYYRWLPRVITRIERDSQVEEDLLEEQRTIRRRRQEIVSEATAVVQGAMQHISRHLGSLPSRYSKSYDVARAEALVLERLSPSLAAASPEESHKVERLVRDAVRLQEIRAALRLYTVRKSWLVSHIGITATLLTLVVVHVVSVLYY